MVNAIEMLKRDHRKVVALFDAFESTKRKALDARHRVVKQSFYSLRTHAAIEDDVSYRDERDAPARA